MNPIGRALRSRSRTRPPSHTFPIILTSFAPSTSTLQFLRYSTLNLLKEEGEWNQNNATIHHNHHASSSPTLTTSSPNKTQSIALDHFRSNLTSKNIHECWSCFYSHHRLPVNVSSRNTFVQFLETEEIRAFLGLLASSSSPLSPLHKHKTQFDVPSSRIKFVIDQLSLSLSTSSVLWNEKKLLMKAYIKERHIDGLLTLHNELLESDRSFPIASLYEYTLSGCLVILREMMASHIAGTTTLRSTRRFGKPFTASDVTACLRKSTFVWDTFLKQSNDISVNNAFWKVILCELVNLSDKLGGMHLKTGLPVQEIIKSAFEGHQDEFHQWIVSILDTYVISFTTAEIKEWNSILLVRALLLLPGETSRKSWIERQMSNDGIGIGRDIGHELVYLTNELDHIIAKKKPTLEKMPSPVSTSLDPQTLEAHVLGFISTKQFTKCVNELLLFSETHSLDEIPFYLLRNLFLSIPDDTLDKSTSTKLLRATVWSKLLKPRHETSKDAHLLQALITRYFQTLPIQDPPHPDLVLVRSYLHQLDRHQEALRGHALHSSQGQNAPWWYGSIVMKLRNQYLSKQSLSLAVSPDWMVGVMNGLQEYNEILSKTLESKELSHENTQLEEIADYLLTPGDFEKVLIGMNYGGNKEWKRVLEDDASLSLKSFVEDYFWHLKVFYREFTPSSNAPVTSQVAKHFNKFFTNFLISKNGNSRSGLDTDAKENKYMFNHTDPSTSLPIQIAMTLKTHFLQTMDIQLFTTMLNAFSKLSLHDTVYETFQLVDGKHLRPSTATLNVYLRSLILSNKLHLLTDKLKSSESASSQKNIPEMLSQSVPSTPRFSFLSSLSIASSLASGGQSVGSRSNAKTNNASATPPFPSWSLSSSSSSPATSNKEATFASSNKNTLLSNLITSVESLFRKYHIKPDTITLNILLSSPIVTTTCIHDMLSWATQHQIPFTTETLNAVLRKHIEALYEDHESNGLNSKRDDQDLFNPVTYEETVATVDKMVDLFLNGPSKIQLDHIGYSYLLDLHAFNGSIVQCQFIWKQLLLAGGVRVHIGMVNKVVKCIVRNWKMKLDADSNMDRWWNGFEQDLNNFLDNCRGVVNVGHEIKVSNTVLYELLSTSTINVDLDAFQERWIHDVGKRVLRTEQITDQNTIEILILHYCRSKDVSQMETMLRHFVQTFDQKPAIPVLSSILHTYVSVLEQELDRGEEDAVQRYSASIEKLLTLLPNKVLTSDPIVTTCLMKAHGLTKAYECGMDLYKSLPGHCRDLKANNTYLWLLTQRNDINTVLEFFNNGMVVKDANSYALIIHMLAHINDLETADYYYHEAIRKGIRQTVGLETARMEAWSRARADTGGLMTDMPSLTNIPSIEERDRKQTVLNIWKDLWSSKQTTGAALSVVLDACGIHGWFTEGERVWREVLAVYPSSMNVNHWTSYMEFKIRKFDGLILRDHGKGARSDAKRGSGAQEDIGLTRVLEDVINEMSQRGVKSSAKMRRNVVGMLNVRGMYKEADFVKSRLI